MNPIENFSLKGKVALVTGAAYGIGFAIAEALASAGAKIAFNCRSQANMDKALEEYAKLGIEAKGYICDSKRYNTDDDFSVRDDNGEGEELGGSYYTSIKGRSISRYRHGKKTNFSFLDGHVETLSESYLKNECINKNDGRTSALFGYPALIGRY